MKTIKCNIWGGGFLRLGPSAGSTSTITAMLVLGLVGLAHSATNTVTSLADSGAGSLRQVIADSAAGDSIVFGVTGTITLNSNELVVAKDLTILGPGASALAVNGAGASRIFNVNSNVAALVSSITITNGRSRDGASTGPGEPGGAIYNSGALWVSNCVITGNRTGVGGTNYGDGGCGGGIYNIGTLRLDESIVSRNTTGGGSWSGSGGSGGGIWNSGTCFASRCSFNSNHAGNGGSGTYVNKNFSTGGGQGGHGAGIFNASVMALTNCTLSNNNCGRGGDGGGGYFQGGSGAPGGGGGGVYSTNSLTMIGCTVAGNQAGFGGGGGSGQAAGGFGAAGGGGGGIFGSGLVLLTNCTLVGNSCGNGGLAASWPYIGGDGGSGGGIYYYLGTTQAAVVACTIVNNTVGIGGGGSSGGTPISDGSGGGVYAQQSGPIYLFLNDIVALNSAPSTGQGPDVYGAFNSLGHNLIGATNDSSGFTAPGDLAGSKASRLDPKLAPLADNGGPTLTMALTTYSPAIDAGAAAGGAATDQRGLARPQGRGVDIGAYEYEFICKITGAGVQSISNFWLQASGLPNQAYTLEISTNLLNWSDLTNLTTDTYGVGEFVDRDASQHGLRYYRLKSVVP
jgi:hypothetical protein